MTKRKSDENVNKAARNKIYVVGLQMSLGPDLQKRIKLPKLLADRLKQWLAVRAVLAAGTAL